MCDLNCMRWAAKHLKLADVQGKRVLEVGAYDVNGSLRYLVELLQPQEYIGVDIVRGPGVDRVCAAADLVQTFGMESFDLVLSTCVLEHVREWRSAISAMKGVCKANGLILFSVPCRWPYHQYPGDFWRYAPEDIREIFSDCGIEALDEDAGSLACVHARISKRASFHERDLASVSLHSVVVNRRVSDIRDKDLHSPYFRWLSIKSRVWSGGWSLVNFMLSKLV